MTPEYGDNEPQPEVGTDNGLTGYYTNMKTGHEIAIELRLGGKGSHDPYYEHPKKNK